MFLQKMRPCRHPKPLSKKRMTRNRDEHKFLPDRSYFRELRRPWKLATFGAGMSWLLYGASSYGISDWDVGISFIMGGLTYLCAPWTVHVLVNAAKAETSRVAPANNGRVVARNVYRGLVILALPHRCR
jgi:hypothetical protein